MESNEKEFWSDNYCGWYGYTLHNKKTNSKEFKEPEVSLKYRDRKQTEDTLVRTQVLEMGMLDNLWPSDEDEQAVLTKIEFAADSKSNGATLLHPQASILMCCHWKCPVPNSKGDKGINVKLVFKFKKNVDGSGYDGLLPEEMQAYADCTDSIDNGRINSTMWEKCCKFVENKNNIRGLVVLSASTFCDHRLCDDKKMYDKIRSLESFMKKDLSASAKLGAPKAEVGWDTFYQFFKNAMSCLKDSKMGIWNMESWELKDGSLNGAVVQAKGNGKDTESIMEEVADLNSTNYNRDIIITEPEIKMTNTMTATAKQVKSGVVCLACYHYQNPEHVNSPIQESADREDSNWIKNPTKILPESYFTSDVSEFEPPLPGSVQSHSFPISSLAVQQTGMTTLRTVKNPEKLVNQGSEFTPDTVSFQGRKSSSSDYTMQIDDGIETIDLLAKSEHHHSKNAHSRYAHAVKNNTLRDSVLDKDELAINACKTGKGGMAKQGWTEALAVSDESRSGSDEYEISPRKTSIIEPPLFKRVAMFPPDLPTVQNPVAQTNLANSQAVFATGGTEKGNPRITKQVKIKPSKDLTPKLVTIKNYDPKLQPKYPILKKEGVFTSRKSTLEDSVAPTTTSLALSNGNNIGSNVQSTATEERIGIRRPTRLARPRTLSTKVTQNSIRSVGTTPAGLNGNNAGSSIQTPVGRQNNIGSNIQPRSTGSRMNLGGQGSNPVRTLLNDGNTTVSYDSVNLPGSLLDK